MNETNFESVLLGLCQQFLPNQGKLNQPELESCWIVPIICSSLHTVRDLRQKHVNNAVLIYRHLFLIDLIVIFG